ncbi:MAG: hypothetical protein RIF36_16525 [Imperialibacter sp.]|uniref:hypothetical protein n=1 Tax=Imperialibacter sp. TaxID=2038411 RepID=UPI0032EDBB09
MAVYVLSQPQTLKALIQPVYQHLPAIIGKPRMVGAFQHHNLLFLFPGTSSYNAFTCSTSNSSSLSPTPTSIADQAQAQIEAM